jgi:tRNA(Ile)-lysidine synthase
VVDAPGPLPAGQPRHALVAEVARQLHHLDVDAHVVLACSAGPDSTALAFLVAEARPDLTLTLVHVAHGWRDDSEDAALVTQHAAWLGCEAVLRDVARDLEVAGGGHGPEAAARDARYRVLREEAAARRAATILVGHTAEDQAETLLLRLARGTGLAGLTGMASVSGDLSRPLLRVRRGDVRRFVTLEGLPVASDPTNADPDVRRVRVRQELLPALDRIGPDPVAALVRLADLVRDDVAALETAATEAIGAGALRRFGPLTVLDRAALAALPAAVAHRIVRAALQAWSRPAPSAVTVARVLAVPSGGGATLPGGVEVTGDARWATLAPVGAAATSVVPLVVPGTTPWEAAGLVVHARTRAAELSPPNPHGAPTDEDRPPGTTADPAGPPHEQLGLDLAAAGGPELAQRWEPPRVRLDPAACPPGGDETRLRVVLADVDDPMVLRPPAAGDRITTARGGRRVATLLRDAGVPRALRRRWPVLTIGGHPVWVPGIAADADALAAGHAAPALALHLGVAPERRPQRD